MTRWKELRHRFEELACRALVWGVPRLSRRACVRVAHFLGSLAFALDRRGRTVALANLECVFAARFTPAERAALTRESYCNFARTMFDLIWASQLNEQTFRDYFRLEGFDLLRTRLAQEQCGAVFMCVHQGNWEWASLAVGFSGLPTTVVAEDFKNPRLTSIFSQLRQISGQQIISQENAMLRLLRIVRRGGRTGMLIDLSFRPTQTATLINAFGLEMCVPQLHALLAARAHALLVPVETEPLSDGCCRIIAHPPVELAPGADTREIAQRCWNVFEPIIRARPALYLWPYKHFRYRPENAARAYPAYANQSSKFEKLRRRLFSQVDRHDGERPENGIAR